MEFKGYVFKIMSGCDKLGFPMKQEVLTSGPPSASQGITLAGRAYDEKGAAALECGQLIEGAWNDARWNVVMSVEMLLR